MATRLPLVLAAGEAQQLQSGDTLLNGFFQVNRNASNQSVTAAANTQIQFNNEVADDNSWFEPSTYKYTPLVAGTYFITVSINISGTVPSGGTYPGIAKIRKNGSDSVTGGLFHFDAGAKAPNEVISTATGVIAMNGSTDYIDFAVYTDLTSPVVQGGVALTFAFGYLLK